MASEKQPANPQSEEARTLHLTDRRILSWLLENLLRPHWLKLVVGTLAMTVGTLCELAPPLLIRALIDDVIGKGQMYKLPDTMLLMLGAFFGSSLFSSVRMNIMHILGQRFVYDLRMKAFAHLEHLSLSYFERNKTGDIMSRLSNDVNSVEDMVVHGTDTVLVNVLNIAFTIIIMFRMSPPLAALALLPLPIYLTLMIFFARKVRPIYRKIREELGEINARLQERISGIRVVKAFGREDHEYEKFDDDSRAYYRANVRGIWYWSAFFPFISFLMATSMVIVVWRGVVTVGALGTTTGTVVAFIGYLQGFYFRFGDLIRVYDIYNRALAALTRIFHLLEEVPEVKDAPDAVELAAVQGAVELDRVSFHYATGELVLRDITVRAAPGETVALVGRSGAGKTSLINLVPRFYDPTEGTVRIDGRDLRTVTQASLRRNIAMVLQETFLFNGTVNENVRYGKLDAADADIERACVAAYADEFIQDLPEKYETQIGERGVKLSGGQKQRLAIARALLANPRILLLDEATSLVDTEAEQIIQKALENLMRNRTTLVIAHRLSTVRRADKIAVIDDGEIVEEADHETLMAAGGLYSEMYTRQFAVGLDWEEEEAETL